MRAKIARILMHEQSVMWADLHVDVVVGLAD